MAGARDQLQPGGHLSLRGASSSSVRNIACDQRSGEGGGPHLATQSSYSRGGGGGRATARAGRRRAPRARAIHSSRSSPLLRLGEPEQRGQQQPLAAAVVGVVEVAADAAAGTDERRHVDRAEAEERKDEQASVQPLLRAREIEVVAEPRRDAGERRGVQALALLPPVDARLLAHALQMGRGRRSCIPPAVAAAVPGGVLRAAPRARGPSRRAGGAASRSGRARPRACSAPRSRDRVSTIRATQSKNASALATSPTRLIASAMKEPSRSQEKPVGREASGRPRSRRSATGRRESSRRWRAGGQRDSMRAPMKDAGGRSSVLPPTVATAQ